MKKTFAPLAILFFVCLLFFWPILKGLIPFPGDLLVNTDPYRSVSILGFAPGAYPNKAQGRDVITELYPWKYFSIQELKNGRIPFWNPHNFSGNILMQNFQSAVFNPTNILFFVLPFPFAWTLFIFIQPLLAAGFFYLFARELKLGKFASLVGSVGFAFSAYMTVWMEYGNISATFAFLPLLLFFILKFLKTRKTAHVVGFIIAASLMILSGYVQGAFYSYVVAFCFVLFALKMHKTKPTKMLLATLAAMFIFPVFFTMFQLFSTYQVFLSSTRWPYSMQQFRDMLQPFWYWVTLFAPDFFGNPATRNFFPPNATYIERVAYIGIPFLFFAVFALLKRKEFIGFFGLLAFFVFILTTNFPGIAFLYTLPIPVINTTVPTRMLSLFMFAGIVLATYGMNEFFQTKKIPKKLLLGISLVYVLLWFGVLSAGKLYPQLAPYISITRHNMVLPTLLAFGTIIVFFLTKHFGKFARLLLFILIVGDLFYGFQKITPFAPNVTLYPKNFVTDYMQKNAGINRYWGYGSGYMQPNYETVDGTYSPEGNDPLHIKNYGELLGSSENGKIPNLPPRPDANLAPGFGQEGMRNAYRQTLLNLLGVKYIVARDELRPNFSPDTQTFSQDTYRLVASSNPWQIYENKTVLPRYFLTNEYIVATGQKALDYLYTLDLRKKLILSKNISSSLSRDTTGEVKLISYGTQKIIFQTKTTGTMLLFLSDTYFPSWIAKVDTNDSVVLLADYSFRAVVVPSGIHTITMYYQPRFFMIGLWISIFTIVPCIIFLFFVRKYEKQR